MGMTETFHGDDRYYEVAQPGSLAEQLLVRARNRIYRDFLSTMRPAADFSILDVGVSTVVGEGANLLERLYPHPARITAVGLDDGAAFRCAFPQVQYLRVAANTGMPFADRAFDIAFSNAVLEHVGSPDAQQALLTELRRVARRVFVAVPNRFFPVEHHTALPLVHYLDSTFRLACRAAGKAQWADPANLILMSSRRLARLGQDAAAYRTGHTGLRLGPFSSNLYLAIG